MTSFFSSFHKTVKDRIRVGRGSGSGKGGTSGKGHKGQLARSGKSSMKHFEGGQTPIFRRLPKRGFKFKNNSKAYTVSLDILISKLSCLTNSSVNLNELFKKKTNIKIVGNRISSLFAQDIKLSVSEINDVKFISKSAREFLSNNFQIKVL